MIPHYLALRFGNPLSCTSCEYLYRAHHRHYFWGNMTETTTTHPTATIATKDYPFHLGAYTRRDVTVADADAQLWLDRGFVWMYGYHHEEAVQCFHRVLQQDPTCLLAHFGVAYAVGCNYNKPWEAFEADETPQALSTAHQHLALGEHLIAKHPGKYLSVEIDLVKAVTTRYPKDVASLGDGQVWNDAFCTNMRQVYRSYPHDLDVCCFYVESMMNRTPWKLWDITTGQPAENADTLQALRVMDTVLVKRPDAWRHPGLLHMYIHVMEMSPHPENALPHGNVLIPLVPDSGHLIHMASHIHVLCGDYAATVRYNHTAIQADHKYVRYNGADNFYTIYRCHNYHFKIYGALFQGSLTPALEAAQGLVDALPESLLQAMPDWFEAFVPMKQHVWIRFGQWQTIVDQDLPADATLYCVTTATMRYAKAVAYANLGQLAAARAEAEAFATAVAKVPASRMLFNNTALDILQVASSMMHGEIAYFSGKHDEAFAHLRRAVQLDDGLPYDEPWGWMQPVRHALGALLMEQGHWTEAEAVYRADLGLEGPGQTTLPRACQHPQNVWSLRGLYDCLQHRGETTEAALIKEELDLATAAASMPIRASCMCSRKACSGRMTTMM